MLETGDVSILFSLSQMKNLVTTIEPDPKGDKITCPAFGLYFSPAEHSTIGHIVLDLTNLAYHPTTKSREQSGHPLRHVTFAMSERRPAYPAHAPDMDEDKDEDDKPLVRPASRKEPPKEKSDLDTDDEDLLLLVLPRPPPAVPVRRRKDAQYGRIQLLHWNKRCQGTRVSEQRMPQFWAAKQKVVGRAKLEGHLHLKHHHMSTAQFKKRTTRLNIPGKIMTSIKTW